MTPRPRLSLLVGLFAGLSLVGFQPSEPTPAAGGSAPTRWAGYLGLPSPTGGPPEMYVYFVDEEDSTFAFRRAVGLPAPGPLSLPPPPERTGAEVVLPLSALGAFANIAKDRGAFDRELESDSGGFGFSVREGRVRLSANHAFSTTTLILGGLLVGVSTLALVALWVSIRRLKREQERQRSMADARSRMEKVREAERTQLAREIHDGPIQDLHALRLQSQTASLLAEHGAEADLERGFQAVAQELRAIMEGLRPPALDRYGFTAAVESHASRVASAGAPVEVAVDVSPEAERFLNEGDSDLQIGTFRVVQEAISNAAQHGGGRRIEVTARVEGPDLVATVSDDGCGLVPGTSIDPEDLADGGHFGLIGMRERAEVMGGELTLKNRPQGGVEVRLSIPLAVFPSR